MRRTRRGFTHIYFAIGNSIEIIHHRRHEDFDRHCPRSFGVSVRRFWLELLSEFHSRATAPARSRWRLFQSLRCQRLHARRRCNATAEWIAVINRPVCSAFSNDSRRDPLQHLDFSHSDGSGRLGPCRDRNPALGFSGLELSRTFRGPAAAITRVNSEDRTRRSHSRHDDSPRNVRRRM